MYSFFRKSYSLFFILFLCVIACDSKQEYSQIETNSDIKAHKKNYLNHHDSVKYLGKEACIICHQNQWHTFQHTGMGQSFGKANTSKSKSQLDHNSVLKDPYLHLNYHPFWKDSLLYLKEFSNKKTVLEKYKRIEKIDYIVGSGQHTNSHILNTNGYLTQVPFTYYTQDGTLDFPPGFENGSNTRFSRKIGLECMSCHNALPDFVLGSENKYKKIPEGIDCERCHGPGSIHVERMKLGKGVDISKEIDFSIVNPKKLPRDLQFDLCSRCHLQGNMVLKNGRNFYDFKPGMPLSEVIDIFLPKYENSDNQFIMASHVDRLKMSSCFQKSEDLSCLSCHNPHISVQQKNRKEYDQTCLNCHQVSKNNTCSTPKELRNNKSCFECHMPKSGSSDIPHVSITDHKIGIHSPKDSSNTKQGAFIDLYCVNNEHPDDLTLSKAYLQQFERFESLPILLKKAGEKLQKFGFNEHSFSSFVHLAYLQKNYPKIINLAAKTPNKWLTQAKATYDNDDAWTFYRIAIAYQKTQQFSLADSYYQKAVVLAPFVLDFKVKWAEMKIRFGIQQKNIQLISDAQKLLLEVLKENPKYETTYTPLAYSFSLEANYTLAEEYYKKALELNPNNINAKTNLAGLWVVQGKKKLAKQLLKEVLAYQKDYPLALQMLKSLELE